MNKIGIYDKLVKLIIYATEEKAKIENVRSKYT